MVEQPITSGLLAGKSININLIDRAGNETSPLFSMYDMRRLRMVVDYEENKVMSKDNPDIWHELPVTKKGLMMITLTNEACERHNTPPLVPHLVNRHTTRRNKANEEADICTAEACDCR